MRHKIRTYDTLAFTTHHECMHDQRERMRPVRTTDGFRLTAARKQSHAAHQRPTQPTSPLTPVQAVLEKSLRTAH